MICTKMTIIFLIFTFFFNYSFADQPSYNVQDYGAKPNGNSDCTQYFLDAWEAACKTKGRATVYVPKGRYLLSKTVFDGNGCNNEETTIRIDGTLIHTPTDYSDENWLVFQEVTGVNILAGKIDAKGRYLWECKRSGKSCNQGAMSLALYNSSDVTINGLTSINSQMFHLFIFGCQNVSLFNTNIYAPKLSPNTDGIHVEYSSEVTISNSLIRTGDDCISIGRGASNVWIEKIACGPGHGISIGSLGWSLQEEGVENVTVKNVTLKGTQNGLRIKTWARLSTSYVRNVLYQNIKMINTYNPILIDQMYCPHNINCPTEGSGVKISKITYVNVWGTSASEVAVALNCSSLEPCRGIKLNQVKLRYDGGEAVGSCDNAWVKISSNVRPKC
ncbi:hypothetical protein CASFOL_012959 [Castilleja foliolosa]|uniref:Polygalacturonase n=1 Tax=Castilleja foliolosa TaxID=1961234 RepID=A0ABD3DME2_9LAMI